MKSAYATLQGKHIRTLEVLQVWRGCKAVVVRCTTDATHAERHKARRRTGAACGCPGGARCFAVTMLYSNTSLTSARCGQTELQACIPRKRHEEFMEALRREHSQAMATVLTCWHAGHKCAALANATAMQLSEQLSAQSSQSEALKQQLQALDRGSHTEMEKVRRRRRRRDRVLSCICIPHWPPTRCGTRETLRCETWSDFARSWGKRSALRR